jgi:hypothetical protein
MRCALDHLVVAAASLQQGAAYVERALGVPTQPGGKHALMSTHNRLLRLDGGAYLEVIAIDPDAPPPGQPRWFALDDLAMRARLAELPRLIHWVARTDDIDAALAACPIEIGAPTELARGDLRWKFALSADGSMPLDGVAPHLIQWLAGQYPSDRLPDAGCALLGLEAMGHEPAQLQAALASLGLADAVRIDAGEPQLRAHISTPNGLRVLD